MHDSVGDKITATKLTFRTPTVPEMLKKCLKRAHSVEFSQKIFLVISDDLFQSKFFFKFLGASIFYKNSTKMARFCHSYGRGQYKKESSFYSSLSVSDKINA